MTNAERTEKIRTAVAFEKVNANSNGGYATIELAREAVKLTLATSYNLVPLGIEERGGFFFPQFNVFD